MSISLPMRRTLGLACLLLGCFILCNVIVSAQGLYPVSTDTKVGRSSLIIEGKVLTKRSFWNSAHTMIYTDNQVEVYKIFKGTLQNNTIDIVTIGGTVDGHYIEASHLLSLDTSDIGVFFCRPERTSIKIPGSTQQPYEVYSSMQGFIKYDLFNKTANTPFIQYDDIENNLYNELRNKTGRNVQIKNNAFTIKGVSDKLHPSNSTLAPAITSFSPATVNAGALLDPTNNVLTINGTGFGSSPGGSAAVLFSHADYASGTQFAVIAYSSVLIISWTDTKIVVRVPTQAGTGVFRVRDNGGTFVNSPSNLTVRYSILTADFGGAYGIKQFILGNMNASGGYSVKYSINTANSGVNINASPAKATFQRALTTWKEASGVNFVEANTSTLQLIDPDDGENLIMYDNGGTTLAPLADGVLATCFSGITICANDPVNNQARKTGFDILIRNIGFSTGTTPFTLGPCPPFSEASAVVDLESVLLHELGHAISMGHIIDPLQGSGAGTATPAKVMHFSVSYNQRRISLDYSAKTGADYLVTPHSYSYGNCVTGSAEMAPLATILEPKDDCPPTFPVSTTPMFSTVNFDLVHATSNKNVDPAYNQMTLDGSGANITNNAYYVFQTNATGGDLSLQVLNYSTSPAAIASCGIGVTGIITTGVKLSIYQVSSCPAAASYPTPVAYMVFQDSGLLPTVSNLAGSTNYLMVVDGIQNTKALFDVVISGSALPLLSTELAGEIAGNANHLSWTTDPDFGVTNMVLERSDDGITFDTLKIISGTQQVTGEYSDLAPLPGENYYRLRVQNSNGSVQYSKVVVLNRVESFALNVYPNPAGPELNIEILSNEPGTYGVSIHNSFGQKVLQKEITVVSRKHVETISIGGFMRGVYYVAAYGKDSKRIKSATIKIK
jgi:hypothetical protein